MERKLLLVFALTFLVIMLFQPLLKKYGPQPPAKQESPQAAPSQAQAPSANSATSVTQTSENAGGIRAAGRRNASAATQPIQQASAETETVIENDVYRIVFTNRGGRVKSWVLKKYTDDKGGQLELVNSAAAEKYGYPLSLWTYDEGLRNKLNAVIFVISNGVYSIEQVYVDLTSFCPGPQHKFDTFDILPKWDYMALAQAFGAKGYCVRTIKELNAVLKELKKITNQPVLVEVIIPEKDLPQQMYRLGNEP